MSCERYGAGGETRTLMGSPPRDFESRASTNSTTPACICSYNSCLIQSISFWPPGKGKLFDRAKLLWHDYSLFKQGFPQTKGSLHAQ